MICHCSIPSKCLKLELEVRTSIQRVSGNCAKGTPQISPQNCSCFRFHKISLNSKIMSWKLSILFSSINKCNSVETYGCKNTYISTCATVKIPSSKARKYKLPRSRECKLLMCQLCKHTIVFLIAQLNHTGQKNKYLAKYVSLLNHQVQKVPGLMLSPSVEGGLW